MFCDENTNVNWLIKTKHEKYWINEFMPNGVEPNLEKSGWSWIYKG